MSEHPLYLDNNATMKPSDEHLDELHAILRNTYGNPSSRNVLGSSAKQLLQETRQALRVHLSLNSCSGSEDTILFNSCATEGINQAVFSTLLNYKSHPQENRNCILYSATEHSAIIEAINYWVKVLNLPLKIKKIPVDELGQIDQSYLKRYRKKAVLVCVMAVNNETGYIQQVTKLNQYAQEESFTWIYDCVQALGNITLDFNRIKPDFAVFSGHKIGAIKGSGALYVKNKQMVHPLIVGGGQEFNLRSGTENTAGIASLLIALKSLQRNPKLSTYKNDIKKKLQGIFPDILFNDIDTQSVSTTLSFSSPSFTGYDLLSIFNAAQMYLSAGSACSAHQKKPSHVLLSMWGTSPRSEYAVRLSMAKNISEIDMEHTLAKLEMLETVLQPIASSLDLLSYNLHASKEGLTRLHDKACIYRVNAYVFILGQLTQDENTCVQNWLKHHQYETLPSQALACKQSGLHCAEAFMHKQSPVQLFYFNYEQGALAYVLEQQHIYSVPCTYYVPEHCYTSSFKIIQQHHPLLISSKLEQAQFIMNRHTVPYVNVDEFSSLVEQGWCIIDVREPFQYALRCQSNPLQIENKPLETLYQPHIMASLQEKKIIFTCSSGRRSYIAACMLKAYSEHLYTAYASL
tara:strand:- start:9566 stop:11458 length:1893 start_codon:yes stop_codon:yes gene_type:complete